MKYYFILNVCLNFRNIFLNICILLFWYITDFISIYCKSDLMFINMLVWLLFYLSSCELPSAVNYFAPDGTFGLVLWELECLKNALWFLGELMVLILAGSTSGAMNVISFVIRHVIRSILRKDLFSFLPAQHVLSYHLIWVPCLWALSLIRCALDVHSTGPNIYHINHVGVCSRSFHGAYIRW